MFCKYCGTQVPEGYICGCPQSQRDAQEAQAAAQAAAQQAQQPQYPQYDEYGRPVQYQQPQYPQYDEYGRPIQYQQPPRQPAGPSFGQKLSDAFKAIPSVFNSLKGDLCGAKPDVFVAGIFAVGSFVVNFLAWLLVFVGIFGDAMEYMDGIYGTALLTGFLAWLIPTGLMLLVSLIGQVARKENVNFVQCFMQAACVNLIPTAMVFLSSLFMLLSIKLGVILLTVTMVMSIIIAGKLVSAQMKNSKGLFFVLLIGFVVAVITLLASWIISAPITDYISYALMGLM